MAALCGLFGSVNTVEPLDNIMISSKIQKALHGSLIITVSYGVSFVSSSRDRSMFCVSHCSPVLSGVIMAPDYEVQFHYNTTEHHDIAYTI